MLARAAGTHDGAAEGHLGLAAVAPADRPAPGVPLRPRPVALAPPQGPHGAVLAGGCSPKVHGRKSEVLKLCKILTV